MKISIFMLFYYLRRKFYVFFLDIEKQKRRRINKKIMLWCDEAVGDAKTEYRSEVDKT